MVGSAGAVGGVASPVAISSSPPLDPTGGYTASLTVTRTRQRRRLHRALQRELRIHEGLHALGEPETHARPGHREVKLTGQVALLVDAPSERDIASGKTASQAVERHAARIEPQRATDVLERVRQREMPDTAVGDVECAADGGSSSGPSSVADSAAMPELRTLATKPCSTARLASPVMRMAMRESWRLATPDTSSCVSWPTMRMSVTRTRMTIQCEADGPGVAQGVVEEPNIEPFDRRVDEEVIDVGELTDDANRSARDSRRVWRQLRLERAT